MKNIDFQYREYREYFCQATFNIFAIPIAIDRNVNIYIINYKIYIHIHIHIDIRYSYCNILDIAESIFPRYLEYIDNILINMNISNDFGKY